MRPVPKSMRILGAAALLTQCISSVHAQEKTITARADMAKETLRSGEARNGWKLARGGQVQFHGKRIGKQLPPWVDAVSELRFSKGNATGAYRYIVWWDSDRGVAQSLIWNTATQSVKASFPPLPEQLADGVFWSPGDKYAVVPQAGEVQEAVYIANLATGQVRSRKVVAKGLKPCEIQGLVDQPPFWKGQSTFRLMVRISENPWFEGGAKCKPKPRTVPIDVPLE